MRAGFCGKTLGIPLEAVPTADISYKMSYYNESREWLIDLSEPEVDFLTASATFQPNVTETDDWGFLFLMKVSRFL
jgi:hypothetical protein